jgi:hypothetical protein
LAQRLKQRPDSLVANFSALIGRPSAYLFLDPVQGSDSLKSLTRYVRSVRLLQIIKLAPNVGPTRRFLNASILIKLIEPRIGIGLQCSSELAKMTLRMFSFAIW